VKVTAGTEMAKLRKLVVNMIYVGVVAELMGIERVEIEAPSPSSSGESRRRST